MAYDKNDLRSQLATAPKPGGPGGPANGATGINVAPQYFEFDKMDPTETTGAGTRTWLVRSQAAVVAFDRAAAGDRLERSDQVDEYTVLIPDEGVEVTIEADGEATTATGPAMVMVPPGASAVTPSADTTLVRLFSSQSDDLCQRCANRDFYADSPDPNVAPFQAWPDPPDGFRIRVYPLDDHPADPDRFGRLFRSTTFMVNYFYDAPGPRNPRKMSPHHHDDFEQLSLQLGGDYVHHIRTPWGVDSTAWRDDEHQHCSSPSVTVIPPPSVHTSEAVGDTSHQLVDIFAPPRFDFSARPGWVINADEYPEPTS